jgi:hypothetical protein
MTAKRLPSIADRSTIESAELEDYDRAVRVIRRLSESYAAADARPRVDGRRYATASYGAWTNTPRLFGRWFDLGQELVALEGLPGRFSRADHEMLDLLLGFDSGYWCFHAGHTANAIAAGVRIEALEALDEGREDKLTDDERLQVHFIRAVRDGEMTDELWAAMVARVGSLRGTIEFACFVCRQLAVHRMGWALGVPAIDINDWRKLVQGYKTGARIPSNEAEDYAELRRRADASS